MVSFIDGLILRDCANTGEAAARPGPKAIPRWSALADPTTLGGCVMPMLHNAALAQSWLDSSYCLGISHNVKVYLGLPQEVPEPALQTDEQQDAMLS